MATTTSACALTAAGLLLWWSCTSAAPSRVPYGAGGGGEGGAGLGGGGSGTFAIGAGGGCAIGCSADLRSIVDCNGKVLGTCDLDTACLGGSCSNDPCAAAEASRTSYGCRYLTMKPEIIMPQGEGACFAAFVANTWSIPVHLDVGYDGATFTSTGFIRIPQGQGPALGYAPYDPQKGLSVGGVAVIFLSQSPGNNMPPCPVAPAVLGETGKSGTSKGKAFSIRTDRPVVLYQILPFGGGAAKATSATLLLPSTAWGTNYVAVAAYKKSLLVENGRPFLTLIAREPGTEITILPAAAIEGGGGIAPSPANVAVTYKIDAGEYLQLSQNAELTGSPIQSNKPVGLFGGASCFNVPANKEACDTGHQQIFPVSAMGHQYVGARHRNRAAASGEETPPWRIVGAVDGTTLSYTPAAPPGAPLGIGRGDVREFSTKGPFVVNSQGADHPFYLAQYMTGGGDLAGEGDPEWVNVVPVDQFLDKYVFFTDPTYPETSIVVVRARHAMTGKFADVKLDCSGTVGNYTTVGDYELARVDLVTGDFLGVKGCANGRREIASSAPFGVTVWGWGGYASKLDTKFVSYAYPAGAGIAPINQVVVLPTPK